MVLTAGGEPPFGFRASGSLGASGIPDPPIVLLNCAVLSLEEIFNIVLGKFPDDTSGIAERDAVVRNIPCDH